MTRGLAPTIYIIILNWNGWEDTIECLKSVEKLDYPDFRVVVVDNGSNDDSLDRIEAWANSNRFSGSYGHVNWRGGETLVTHSSSASNKNLTLIESKENCGFAGGCNIGIRYALGSGVDYVWLLNNDTIVAPDALKNMVKLAEADSTMGLVGSVLYDIIRRNEIQAYGGGRVYEWIGIARYYKACVPNDDLQYITGASMLLKRALIEDIGLLDESFFMYWEDADYGFRVRKSGWKLGVACESSIWHKEFASLSKSNSVLDGYFNASAVRFFRKHHLFPYVPISIGVGGRLLKRFFRLDWKGALATFRGVLEGQKQC